jgi:hypothetical protein
VSEYSHTLEKSADGLFETDSIGSTTTNRVAATFLPSDDDHSVTLVHAGRHLHVRRAAFGER